MKEILLTVYGMWVFDLPEFLFAYHLLEQWRDIENILRNLLTSWFLTFWLIRYRNKVPEENEMMDSININAIMSMY